MIQIFRAAALRRLDTPEQLDRALPVTTARAWLALAALLVIAAALITWSVTGHISTFVRADGVLLNRGGRVVDAVTTGVGTLIKTVPEVGDIVREGEVVAETVDEEKAARLRSALARTEEFTRVLAERKIAAEAENALTKKNLDQQRERLQRLEQSGTRSVEAARKRLDDHLLLFETRVVTRITLDRSQQAFDQAQHELFDILRRQDDLESRELRRQHDLESRITDAEAQKSAAEREAEEIKASLRTQRILAPAAGRVIELKAAIGTVLRVGQAVLSIESGGKGLEALAYLPPSEGKRVKPGMRALVVSSLARREEYGALIGAVEYVSEFPASPEGMIAVLQNRDLVESFSRQGPPYACRVVLLPDPTTASGLSWTSSRGADLSLSPGVLATVEIEVERKPPIALVVPLIRETLGL